MNRRDFSFLQLHRRILIWLIAGACGCASTVWAQQWTELGPAPITNGFTGRISSVVCSQMNSLRYYVAGADGGVWRTTDAGATWTPLTDHMPTSAIGALAIDPTNDNIIYAGTGEANFANHSRYGLGLYKSTDGGDTWQHLAVSTFGGRCFSKIIVNHVNPQILYASITRAGGFPEMAAAKGHPGATGPRGVFKSTDGGQTWNRLTGLPDLCATDLVMDPTNPTILYACIGRIFGATENGIYKSTNSGTTWTKLASGLPTGTVGRISIAIAPSNPQRLYAMFTNPATSSGGNASTLGGFRSDNGGSSWSQINLGSIQATYGWYLSAISVHPNDANTAFFAGLSLVRTTNAGSSFSTVTPPHVDLHALAWDTANRLLAGDDGGLHRSGDLGNSWSSHGVGLGVIQFYAGLSAHPTNPDILFGGTQDNGTVRRTTNSTSWAQVIGGDGGWTQLDQNNPNIVFGEVQGTGQLFRSTNGGSSFGGSSSGINGSDRNCFLPPYLINPANSARMLYATHRIYRSVSGGTSWTAISGDLTDGAGAIRALAQSPIDPNIVYAATNDGNVQVSLNEGVTWTQIRNNHPGWPRVTRELYASPRDAFTMYLAGAVYGVDQIQRTEDAGATFVALDGDLPDFPVNCIAEANGFLPHILAGTDAGVYFSTDDGATWTRYGAGMPNAAVIDIRIDNQHDRLVVGTQGRGAWAAPLPSRATLLDFAFAMGSHTSGGLSDLEDSDDSRLRGRSQFGFIATEANVLDLVVGAQSDVANPDFIDLVVESRLNNPNGTTRLRLKNWNSGNFEQIHLYPIGTTETAEVVRDIAAANRVRTSDDRIELSIRQFMVATFSAGGFDTFVDHVGIGLR